jgi:hypothetical protein
MAYPFRFRRLLAAPGGLLLTQEVAHARSYPEALG